MKTDIREGNVNESTWIDYMRKFKPEISDDEAEYILWNETCYPFDNETTLKQLEHYFNQNK